MKDKDKDKDKDKGVDVVTRVRKSKLEVMHSEFDQALAGGNRFQ